MVMVLTQIVTYVYKGYDLIMCTYQVSIVELLYRWDKKKLYTIIDIVYPFLPPLSRSTILFQFLDFGGDFNYFWSE